MPSPGSCPPSRASISSSWRPGSDAIGELPRVECVEVPIDDHGAIVDVARANAVELAVIGPEQPLADGLADALRAAGVVTFGPSVAAARIETSKAFCHEVAEAAGVRMAEASLCRSVGEAMAAVRVVRPGPARLRDQGGRARGGQGRQRPRSRATPRWSSRTSSGSSGPGRTRSS